MSTKQTLDELAKMRAKLQMQAILQAMGMPAELESIDVRLDKSQTSGVELPHGKN